MILMDRIEALLKRASPHAVLRNLGVAFAGLLGDGHRQPTGRDMPEPVPGLGVAGATPGKM